MEALFAAFAVIRIGIGLAPIVAAGPLVRALGFPPGEDTASARAFARLFGVRDIGLGALILWAIPHPEAWVALIALNGATDLGDCIAFLVGLRGRPDLRRPFGACAAVAASAVLGWCLMAVAAGRL